MYCTEVEWLRITLMTTAVVTVAGSCMVLKHDGMDWSFEFSWLPPSAATLSHARVDSMVVVLFVAWTCFLLACFVRDGNCKRLFILC